MNITDRMTELLQARGVKPREVRRTLSNACGITYEAVRQWFAGDTANIKNEHLMSIALAFRTSVDWLLTGNGQRDFSTFKGSAAAEPLHEDAPRDTTGDEYFHRDDGLIPIFGTAKLEENGYFESVDFPATPENGFVRITSVDSGAYALKVIGDALQPRIRSGEFVLIEPNNPYITAGEEVLVQVDDGSLAKSMIKIFKDKQDGLFHFFCINGAHPPLTIDESSVIKMHLISAIINPSRYLPA
ncbi:Phage repressor protein C, contains Cro/C1-type HTH and peptisase s24 domains [Pseudomonas pohangensis]|uniref:Phage repressor protein C, contains Cro/C1-type HTH and peptisase s24 domains n=1 Tax=Pseudomonas pohangensis TaxID=364197 RepID=A0A1H2G332_9PSED|nr:S24 family peptidase [Pseudomonas pohangensis]SDU13994.1 Phage repressor protein C, contains Cro/C1-type HTH and peptisase s24 domains [Pseudomonas pohangensis]